MNKFEAHVTVEPLQGQLKEHFDRVCQCNGFKPANLVMIKEDGSSTPSNQDTFCTARGNSVSELKQLIYSLAGDLDNLRIKIWRYKIESIIIDSKFNDELNLL